MKILNPFLFGLFAALGVLVAMLIGLTVVQLQTIITYVGIAIFLALGIDPIVSWLEDRKIPRWAAILIVLTLVLAAIAGLVWAIIPVVVMQVSNAIETVPDIVERFANQSIFEGIQDAAPWLPLDQIIYEAQRWLSNLNYSQIASTALDFGIGIVAGLTGALIVFILTLYFTSSINGIKRGLYRLVPASRRPRFIELSEQIMAGIGRFVMGQGALGLMNGVLSFIVLTLVLPMFGLHISYSALLAAFALFGSLIPLVGTVAATIVNVLLVLMFDGPVPALVVAIYYVVYMQIEAYVISPRIMSSAVRIPGAVVVIAALAGGTLLGPLGALVAIPVAAGILLLINEVVVPRQDER